MFCLGARLWCSAGTRQRFARPGRNPAGQRVGTSFSTTEAGVARGGTRCADSAFPSGARWAAFSWASPGVCACSWSLLASRCPCCPTYWRHPVRGLPGCRGRHGACGGSHRRRVCGTERLRWRRMRREHGARIRVSVPGASCRRRSWLVGIQARSPSIATAEPCVSQAHTKGEPASEAAPRGRATSAVRDLGLTAACSPAPPEERRRDVRSRRRSGSGIVVTQLDVTTSSCGSRRRCRRLPRPQAECSRSGGSCRPRTATPGSRPLGC